FVLSITLLAVDIPQAKAWGFDGGALKALVQRHSLALNKLRGPAIFGSSEVLFKLLLRSPLLILLNQKIFQIYILSSYRL
ncbi:hypothetical protein J4G08_13925, partial [Candidatus Poribacteria bacterium]|nr:hypothetical protein [Candidatus Poribacteria bacterium]